jgi:gluconokinase
MAVAPPSPPRVIIVMGVSGSGKTVVGRLLAEGLGLDFHDADDHHPPENVDRMRRGIPLEDEHRGPWLDRLAGLVDDALAGGRGIVLACSALKRRYRDRIGAGRPGVRLVHLDGAEDVLRKRLEQRTGHFMPPSLLASQCALLERPADDEAAITVDVTAGSAEIVRCIVAELSRS